jgi:hypothetical protein
VTTAIEVTKPDWGAHSQKGGFTDVRARPGLLYQGAAILSAVIPAEPTGPREAPPDDRFRKRRNP